MKILVDCRTFTRNIAGTAMFLKLAIQAWAKEFPEDELLLVAPQSFKPEVENNIGSRILIKPFTFLGLRLPNFIWFLLYLPLLLFREKPDLYFTPSPAIPFILPRKTKTLIIVHDVVNIEMGGTMEMKNKIQNILLFGRSVKKADYIWTNSNYTKEKVMQYFPKRKSTSIFSGLSVDSNVFVKKNITVEKEKQLRDKYNLGSRFLLFVGTIEPRKNLEFLLHLMPKLAERIQVKLIVVGAKGWKESNIYRLVEENESLKTNVVFPGFVPEEDLVDLYNIADCFVSTSLNEGFGMPQLEAMMCKCPVVTAHNSAMIEVVAGRGVTVEGWQEQKWLDEICRVVDLGRDSFYADDLNLRQFDWTFIIKGLVRYIGSKNEIAC